MSGESENIKKSLIQILGLDGIYQDVIPCKVNSVSGNLCQCTTLAGEKDLVDVRLSSESDVTNILITPSVGSVVMVGMIDDVNGVVVMYGKIDSIAIHGAQYDGLVRVSDLTTKLNNLENKLNSIISIFNTHVHSGVQTGSGSSAVTPTLITGTITPTNQSEIENTKVKHG